MTIDLLFALAVALVAGVVGWFLRGAPARPADDSDGVDHNQLEYVRQAMAHLQELADGVAADVGTHSTRVEEINEELTSGEVDQVEAVKSVVHRLVEANSWMQEQLTSADERLKEQARQIESTAVEARTDALTSLANRRAFDDEMAARLAEFQRHGRVFSLMLLDVDHFKRFNDTHGHQAGDEVLRRLGGVLRQKTREMDIPARYGGEEFAVVLPGTAVEESNASAERLRMAVESTKFRFAGNDLRVAASIGVAEVLAGENAPALIERADEALYASKQAGRNCTHWHDGEMTRPVGVEEEPDEKPVPVEPVAEQAKVEASDRAAEEPKPPTTAPDAQPEGPKQDSKPTPALTKTESARTTPRAQPADTQQGPGEGLSFHDVLTQRLAEWRRGGAPPAILLVHVDEYGEIVATHGKSVGNLVLRATTQFLNAALREMDLVAQQDVATFAVVLPGTGMHGLAVVAERLREAISQCSLPLQNGRLRFTVSVSGATATGDEDAQKLQHRAVKALDAALKAGGNSSHFHNGQQVESADAAMEKV